MRDTVPPRDKLLIQRLVELLSHRNLMGEFPIALGGLPSRASEIEKACQGYLTQKQPKWTLLAELLDTLRRALVGRAEWLEAVHVAPVLAAIDEAVQAPPATRSVSISTLRIALHRLHIELQLLYPEGLLDHLVASAERMNDERARYEALAKEVAATIVDAGTSTQAAVRALTAALHRRDLQDPLLNALVTLLRPERQEYTVLVPLHSNKPLAQAERHHLTFVDEPRAWDGDGSPRLSARWLHHLHQHFKTRQVQGLVARVVAPDPYSAGAAGSARVQRALDAYRAISPVLEVNVLRPHLVLKPNLRPVIEPHETPATTPALPLVTGSDERVASAIRFLSLARSTDSPIVSISLAWVAVETLVAEQRPFEFLVEVLPAAVLPALLRRKVVQSLRLALAEMDSAGFARSSVVAIQRALGNNAVGYLKAGSTAHLLSRYAAGDRHGHIGLFAHGATLLSPLAMRHINEAVALLVQPGAVAEYCNMQQAEVKAVLVQMYLMRNAVLHGGAMSAARELALRSAATRVTDMSLEVIDYWLRKERVTPLPPHTGSTPSEALFAAARLAGELRQGKRELGVILEN